MATPKPLEKSVTQTWQKTGYGHLAPATARRELRQEIDERMSEVQKLVANKELSPEERIAKIESLKNEIWERKSRIADIKRDQREGGGSPRTKLAPIVRAPAADVVVDDESAADRRPADRQKSFLEKPGFRI